MPKPLNQDHADAARRALSASGPGDGNDLSTRVQDLLIDLAHLCDAESLDFLGILTRALRHWSVERIDPSSVLEGPSVQILIGTEGLPAPPKPKPRPGAKPRKVRTPR